MSDTGLSPQEIDVIDRNTKWVVLEEIQPDFFRSFAVGSLSDQALAKKVTSLSATQLRALLTCLRSRRQR